MEYVKIALLETSEYGTIEIPLNGVYRGYDKTIFIAHEGCHTEVTQAIIPKNIVFKFIKTEKITNEFKCAYFKIIVIE